MITGPDFEKKQMVFVFAVDGDRISLNNDNLIVKDKEEQIKLQCTCYRLFIVFVIGNCSITTPMIQKANKIGFFFVLMTSSFRVFNVIGACKEGNILLKQRQYSYQGLELAKHITKNKIENSMFLLKNMRSKTEFILEGISFLEKYLELLPACDSLNSIMAYEGLASKVYFERYFASCGWKGRQPRLKKDVVNSSLDIGYTLLFNFVDSILECFGFDLFCGVMHRQFYMRKSLVCDIVEPFRCIVDTTVKKAYNLKQIQEKDFFLEQGRYLLKWENSKRYVQFLMEPILYNKNAIFSYIQDYYRNFMKNSDVKDFPSFHIP